MEGARGGVRGRQGRSMAGGCGGVGCAAAQGSLARSSLRVTGGRGAGARQRMRQRGARRPARARRRAQRSCGERGEHGEDVVGCKCGQGAGGMAAACSWRDARPARRRGVVVGGEVACWRDKRDLRAMARRRAGTLEPRMVPCRRRRGCAAAG